ncbi:MAG: hypothetical protein NTZ33_14355 [Bacteroidetes bacterium]|nr:hypothetical protein [Bacteroidota bacterium]
MKELPILFSTPMVNLLDLRRKSQTRRICKYQNWSYQELYDFNVNGIHSKKDRNVSSKYQVGDILWVKETFAKGPYYFGKGESTFYKAACGEQMISELKWKSSLFMPKELARVWLRVTHVKVERLQSISFNDAINEGIRLVWYKNKTFFLNPMISSDNHFPKADIAFMNLWDNIHGEQSHGKNPWVFAYMFEILSTSGRPTL